MIIFPQELNFQKEGTFSQVNHLPLWQHPSLSLLYLHPLTEKGNLCSAKLNSMSGHIPVWVYTALPSAGVSLAGKVNFGVLECHLWSWYTFGKASFQPLLRPSCSPCWEPCSWCLVSLMVPTTVPKTPGKSEPRMGKNQESTAPSHSIISSWEGVEMRHHTRDHQHVAALGKYKALPYQGFTICVYFSLV